MGKKATKSAALKLNLITKYHACYLCYNIQYEMCETSTEIYIYEAIFTTPPNEIETISPKTTQKRIVQYITLILTLPFWPAECKIDASQYCALLMANCFII